MFLFLISMLEKNKFQITYKIPWFHWYDNTWSSVLDIYLWLDR